MTQRSTPLQFFCCQGSPHNRCGKPAPMFYILQIDNQSPRCIQHTLQSIACGTAVYQRDALDEVQTASS